MFEDRVEKHTDNISDQINEMGCAYVDFFLKNPAYLRLLFFSDIDKKISMSDSSDEEKMEKPEAVFYTVVNRYVTEQKSLKKHGSR
jgi:hypothetical protein